MPRARIPEFLRFCIVGGIGFLVDAGLLELLVYHGMTTEIARAFSIAVALHVTYLLHGAFTFRGHRGYSLKSWGLFLALNLLGAGVNYTVFIIVHGLAPFKEALLDRQCALIAGTAIALGCNYWLNRRYVFFAGERA